MVTNDTVIAVLKAADRLLANGWCRGAAARDRYGKPVSPAGDAACKWCLDGSIRVAAYRASPNGMDVFGLQDAARSAIIQAVGGQHPVGAKSDQLESVVGMMNDGRGVTVKTVRGWIETAIERLETPVPA